MAAEPFLDRTQVAAEQRRVGRQTDRALDRFRCCFLVSGVPYGRAERLSGAEPGALLEQPPECGPGFSLPRTTFLRPRMRRRPSAVHPAGPAPSVSEAGQAPAVARRSPRRAHQFAVQAKHRRLSTVSAASRRGDKGTQIGRRASPPLARRWRGTEGRNLPRRVLKARFLASIVSGQMMGQVHRGCQDELRVCERLRRRGPETGERDDRAAQGNSHATARGYHVMKSFCRRTCSQHLFMALC